MSQIVIENEYPSRSSRSGISLTQAIRTVGLPTLLSGTANWSAPLVNPGVAVGTTVDALFLFERKDLTY